MGDIEVPAGTTIPYEECFSSSSSYINFAGDISGDVVSVAYHPQEWRVQERTRDIRRLRRIYE